MGFWRRVLGFEAVDVLSSAPTFATDPVQIGGADIDPAVFGLTSYATETSPAPRIDRRSAIQVPAVKRTRDLIAGTLGGLPVDVFDRASREVVPSTFLAQPERNVPRSVTMTKLFEDMLFEGVAWWRVTELTWDGWPRYVKRVAPWRIVVDDDLGKVYIDGREIPDHSELIRFDSPTDGLLKAGARAIRTCLALDVYAYNAAQGIPPMDYFVPAEDADPFASVLEDPTAAEAEEAAAVDTFLSDWATARRTRGTAYIPAALRYQTVGFDPKTLQLAEQRQHAVLEIARVGGIDPEELGVSVTSRTYANQFDRRKAFTDFTLGQYRQAFEDRVSMGDVTPRTQYAKLSLDAFLRSDPQARYAAYALGLQVGAIGTDEIRPLEDKPQLTAAQRADVPAPAQPADPGNVTQLPTRGTA